LNASGLPMENRQRKLQIDVARATGKKYFF